MIHRLGLSLERVVAMIGVLVTVHQIGAVRSVASVSLLTWLGLVGFLLLLMRAFDVGNVPARLVATAVVLVATVLGGALLHRHGQRRHPLAGSAAVAGKKAFRLIQA